MTICRPHRRALTPKALNVAMAAADDWAHVGSRARRSLDCSTLENVMLLTKPFVASDAFKRKRPSDHPDIRAPEDRMVARDDGEEHAPISSPEIEKAIVNWVTARHDGDEDDLKRAGREVVDATARYYRSGGMPLFAHHPLPPQLVKAEVGDAQSEHAAGVIGGFIRAFDDAVQPAVSLQVNSALAHARKDGPQGQMRSIYNAGEGAERQSSILRSQLYDRHPLRPAAMSLTRDESGEGRRSDAGAREAACGRRCAS
jgi:hypothetical protein